MNTTIDEDYQELLFFFFYEIMDLPLRSWGRVAEFLEIWFLSRGNGWGKSEIIIEWISICVWRKSNKEKIFLTLKWIEGNEIFSDFP